MLSARASARSRARHVLRRRARCRPAIRTGRSAEYQRYPATRSRRFEIGRNVLLRAPRCQQSKPTCGPNTIVGRADADYDVECTRVVAAMRRRVHGRSRRRADGAGGGDDAEQVRGVPTAFDAASHRRSSGSARRTTPRRLRPAASSSRVGSGELALHEARGRPRSGPRGTLESWSAECRRYRRRLS